MTDAPHFGPAPPGWHATPDWDARYSQVEQVGAACPTVSSSPS